MTKITKEQLNHIAKQLAKIHNVKNKQLKTLRQLNETALLIMIYT